ncbi:hypothetical protein OAA67_00740 [Winogradskyella sp.]|nr:hypothetical protein [Winogradskyella sp.]
MKITIWQNQEGTFGFYYTKRDSTALDFNFIFKGDTIQGSLTRFNEKDFLLTKRDFY